MFLHPTVTALHFSPAHRVTNSTVNPTSLPSKNSSPLGIFVAEESFLHIAASHSSAESSRHKPTSRGFTSVHVAKARRQVEEQLPGRSRVPTCDRCACAFRATGSPVSGSSDHSGGHT